MRPFTSTRAVPLPVLVMLIMLSGAPCLLRSVSSFSIPPRHLVSSESMRLERESTRLFSHRLRQQKRVSLCVCRGVSRQAAETSRDGGIGRVGLAPSRASGGRLTCRVYRAVRDGATEVYWVRGTWTTRRIAVFVGWSVRCAPHFARK